MTETQQPTKPSIVFDINNPNWMTEKEYNILFLRGVQTHMQLTLMHRGHVLLNDVLDAIGAPRTKRGLTEGWIKGGDPEHITFEVTPLSTNTFQIAFNTQGDIVESFES